MRTATQLATATLLAASVVHALPEFSITRRDAKLQNSHAARGVVAKRQSSGDSTVETSLYDVLTWSQGGAYYINATIGTPPQTQVLILDTGSSDLYVDASNSTACELPASSQYGCRGNSFDPSKSNTFKVVEPSPAFNTSFGDGSTAYGPFATDKVCVGDVCVSNMQLGVGENVNSTTGFAVGLLGIGYSAIEGSQSVYPNLPEALKNAGVINSRLYSIYLNSESETSGSILFGGIDTSKYTGDLVTIDFLPDEITGVVDQFITTVTAVTVSQNGKKSTIISGGSNSVSAYGQTDRTSSSALPVLLDTGSSAWSLDQSVWRLFEPYFKFVDSNGYCSCSHQNDNLELTLEFGGAVNITVPASNFIVPVYNASTNEPIPYTSGSNTCTLMISPSPGTGEGFQTLGDAILRSMYLVYDLDNGQVSIAQANTNSSSVKPNIITVPAGGPASVLKSSYIAAPHSQTYPIASMAPTSLSYSASTAQTPIGTATGIAAVPEDAVPSDWTSSGSSGAATATTSAGAAAGLAYTMTGMASLWIAGLWVSLSGLGALLLV